MKDIVIGIVYCVIATPIIFGILSSGWVIPAAVAPPTGWPFDPAARANYKPNWQEAKEYFIP